MKYVVSMLCLGIRVFFQFYFDSFELLKWQKKSRRQKSGNVIQWYCFSGQQSRRHLQKAEVSYKDCLSDAENNTSGSLNSEDIADLLFLKTLLAICQKSQEPSFWEVMDSFVLLAYASFAVSRTLLQWLLACLNFTLDSENLFCWYKQKSDFYELW